MYVSNRTGRPDHSPAPSIAHGDGARRQPQSTAHQIYGLGNPPDPTLRHSGHIVLTASVSDAVGDPLPGCVHPQARTFSHTHGRDASPSQSKLLTGSLAPASTVSRTLRSHTVCEYHKRHQEHLTRFLRANRLSQARHNGISPPFIRVGSILLHIAGPRTTAIGLVTTTPCTNDSVCGPTAFIFHGSDEISSAGITSRGQASPGTLAACGSRSGATSRRHGNVLRARGQSCPPKHNYRTSAGGQCQRGAASAFSGGKLRAHPELGLLVISSNGVQRFGARQDREWIFCLDHLSGPVDPFMRRRISSRTPSSAAGRGKISVRSSSTRFGCGGRVHVTSTPVAPSRATCFSKTATAWADLAHPRSAGYFSHGIGQSWPRQRPSCRWPRDVSIPSRTANHVYSACRSLRVSSLAHRPISINPASST